MPEAIRGQAGAGSVDVYTVPRDHMLRLELLTFTLTTDATAGVHAPAVIFTDPAVAAVTGRIWDWNEGGPSMTLYYTFGIGLAPFDCTLTTGMLVPVALPDTILAHDTVITVESLNVAGASIAGDQISNVILYGELLDLLSDTPVSLPDLIPGLLPGEAAA